MAQVSISIYRLARTIDRVVEKDFFSIEQMTQAQTILYSEVDTNQALSRHTGRRGPVYYE